MSLVSRGLGTGVNLASRGFGHFDIGKQRERLDLMIRIANDESPLLDIRTAVWYQGEPDIDAKIIIANDETAIIDALLLIEANELDLADFSVFVANTLDDLLDIRIHSYTASVNINKGTVIFMPREKTIIVMREE